MTNMVDTLPSVPSICRFMAADAIPHIGWWDGAAVRDLSHASAGGYATIAQLLAEGSPLSALAGAMAGFAPGLALESVQLLAPIDALSYPSGLGRIASKAVRHASGPRTCRPSP